LIALTATANDALPQGRESNQGSQEEQASHPILKTGNREVHLVVQTTGEDSKYCREKDMSDQ
jgi:hypothetical protein